MQKGTKSLLSSQLLLAVLINSSAVAFQVEAVEWLKEVDIETVPYVLLRGATPTLRGI